MIFLLKILSEWVLFFWGDLICASSITLYSAESIRTGLVYLWLLEDLFSVFWMTICLCASVGWTDILA